MSTVSAAPPPVHVDPFRDDTRTAADDAAAYSAGPAVPLIYCRVQMYPTHCSSGWDKGDITSPRTQTVVRVYEPDLSAIVPDLARRLGSGSGGMVPFTLAELSKIAAVVKADDARSRRIAAMALDRQAHPRGRSGRFTSRFR